VTVARKDGPIGVYGTGVMAAGIASVTVASGFAVVLSSGSRERADALRVRLLDEVPEGRVSTDRSDLSACGILIEATVEDLEAKREVLRQMEALVEEDALMATTTSSLSVTELAAGLRRPGRFLGVHFFNPVAKMALVEVVAGQGTERSALERGSEFARALGKQPLTVGDRAGFLVNRLLIPYLNQAARLVESGVASVQDVDAAMTLGAAHPMGPFALIDLIGIDVCLAIGRSLYDEYHRTSDAPSHGLKSRAAFGFLGRKTGRGYYDYPPRGSAAEPKQ
jgi:3-hydroxybutyryl-CoA dehydrogenase